MITPAEINKAYGNLDLYLFDQILKGRFDGKKIVLDCGCGEGRNLKYFISSGFQVYGADTNAEALKMANLVYGENIFLKNAPIETQPFPTKSCDIILCINVLHHCNDEAQFLKVFEAMAKMLKPGGVLFIRTLLNSGEKHGFKNQLFHFSKQKFIHLIKINNFNLLEPLKQEITDEGNRNSIIVLSRS